MTTNSEKAQLRRVLKRARRQLSAAEQRAACIGVAKQARYFWPLRKAQRIGSYRAFGGEIETHALEQLCNGAMFLPRITHFYQARMAFYPAKSSHLVNSLGISEPVASSRAIPVNQLDLILIPLVAFDRSGNRLGMGAGFYDRALEFKRHGASPNKPLLVGVAHHFQESDHLPSDSWDIPLNAIITPQELITL